MAVRQQISNTDVNLQLLRIRYLAAVEWLEEAKRGAFIQLGFCRGHEVLDSVPDAKQGIVAFSNSGMGHALGAAGYVVDALKDRPELAEAQRLLDPLYSQLAAALAEEQAEASGLIAAENTLADAREAALERARIAAEKDPAVVAASKQLGSFRRLGEEVTA